MKQTTDLVNNIVEGIREKKGRDIVTIDLHEMDAECKYFVICQGGSPAQVEAIAGSIYDYVHKEAGEKPVGVSGLRNTSWVVIDYADVMVHVFLPEEREFYDLEHLWEDAPTKRLPNID